jgi:hypothetical protein
MWSSSSACGAITPFTLMQIRETLPPDSSNEYFGQFYSSTKVYINNPVPEPSVNDHVVCWRARHGGPRSAQALRAG